MKLNSLSVKNERKRDLIPFHVYVVFYIDHLEFLFENRAAKGETEGIVYSLEYTRCYFASVISI
jgi:hypothetical protein